MHKLFHFYVKISKTRRQFDEEKFRTSTKSATTNTMKIWGGGGVKEEMVYVIDAQEVKKELKKPTIKKIGRSRTVLIFEDP